MENEKNEERFKSIEKKLSILVMLASIQSVGLLILIICLVVQQFMPSTVTLVLFLAVLAAFLYFFRSQVPGWVGSISRWAFSQMFAAQKSESMKDIK